MTEAAIEQLNNANETRQLDSKNIELHFFLAESYSALGDFEDAAENFETSLIQLDAKGHVIRIHGISFFLSELKLAEDYDAGDNFP